MSAAVAPACHAVLLVDSVASSGVYFVQRRTRDAYVLGPRCFAVVRDVWANPCDALPAVRAPARQRWKHVRDGPYGGLQGQMPLMAGLFLGGQQRG